MSDRPSDLTARVPFWRTTWFNALSRLLAFVIVFAFFAVLVEDGKFLKVRNLENLLRQSAVYATAAIGMTMIIIAAGIDLSVGSIIALSVIVIAYVLNLQTEVDGRQVALMTSHPTLLPVAAIIAGLLTASLAGLVNGVLVVTLRLTPFIVTLGTMGIFRGLAKGISDEQTISPPDSWLTTLMDSVLTRSESRWQLLPTGIWFLLISAVLAALALRWLKIGRYTFAIGSNEETARLCGVPVATTKLLVYACGGFFAGLSALLLFADVGIGEPTSAISYELFIIAAVVIGGGSLMGGEGSILGSLIGALIITTLYMGGQQMGWPKWVQEIVIGAIIIGAVTIDKLRHRRLT